MVLVRIETVQLKAGRRLWFFAIVNDKLLVEIIFAVAPAGVQKGDRELIIRFGSAVVVYRSNNIDRVRTIRTNAVLLITREHLLRLISSMGNFWEIVITIATEELLRSQVTVIVVVPFDPSGATKPTHLMFLKISATGARLVTTRSAPFSKWILIRRRRGRL